MGLRASQPVGKFDGDCSPFGVRDLAGCIRELCTRSDDPEKLTARGGCWGFTLPMAFRCDASVVLSRATKGTDVGFRVCVS